MTDRKIDINLRIAGVALTLHVALHEEQLLREAAEGINQLWKDWREQFPSTPATEIMAMVTLRFAQGYLAMKSQNERAEKQLAEFEAMIDHMLLGDNMPDSRMK